MDNVPEKQEKSVIWLRANQPKINKISSVIFDVFFLSKTAEIISNV